MEVCWDVDALRRPGRDRRGVDAIDTTGDAAGDRLSAIGQVIGPPIQPSSRARGTRNCLPRRMTGIPLAPSVARYSRASSYALLLPIRRTAAASSTVRKSGTLSSRYSRFALTLLICLSKRNFVTLPWSSTTRFLDRGSGVERVITRIQSLRSLRRSNILRTTFLAADELSFGVNWCWLVLLCAPTTSSAHVDARPSRPIV
jgi:hypothetical protein